MKNGKSKLVLVAGGAGFLGSHLCDALLSEGAHVVALDNLLTGRKQNLRHLEREPRFEFVDGDIIKTLPARIRSKRMKFDQIFNLACAASPPHYQADPEHTLLTSVVGTHNLLTLAEDIGARFFLASTSEIYGDPEVHPQRESYWGHVNPTGPRACYDEGKRAAETLTFDFKRSGRADVRIARIFNTYGPRMRADDGRVVSNVICQALAGDDITIYGDGSQTRSFCYVSDLIEGFLKLMAYEGPFTGAVNLGNPVELTVADLARRVLAMTGSASRIVTRPLPVDDPRRRRPDITLAKQLLNWSPRTSLEVGLKETVAWFSKEQETAQQNRAPELAIVAPAE
ncbi:UDP-glucuronic acid decarboxylase family protein [Microvirga thermotolerans]|uniref:UDP-glucuronate decarboxylase n=1 Tax=Microvirga thermotolerans TaxID=2651334 RepID=A0A5P9K0S3_9HYPH|nr:UDP-glucuronic acid decarboxylase family protein [Microvirga thermotolerans]QFU17618.1 NAD-dependent epimerase/dehydratase family protein [Microvirga thermotolerans]